jgi:hypothetical protein
MQQQQLQLIAAGAAAHRQDVSTVSDSDELSMIPAGVATAQPRKHEKTPRADQQVALLALSDSDELSMIPAGIATTQPRKRETTPRADQQVALLALVQSFEGEHAGQKEKPPQSLQATKQTKSDPYANQLQSNTTQLQHPLSSWENARQWLEQQLTSQQGTLETSQAERSGEDGAIAVHMWLKRNVLGCSAVSIAIAICLISAMSRNKREKKSQPVQCNNEPVQVEFKEQITSDVSNETKEQITSEVSKHLADLADLVQNLKMPSEGSSQLALQAMQANRMPAAEVIPDNEDGTHDI